MTVPMTIPLQQLLDVIPDEAGFTRSNAKLGKMLNWSIPTISTCPGKTPLCEQFCYAERDAKRFHHTVGPKRDANLIATKSSAFTGWAIDQIERSRSDVVRVHVAGDFYDAGYAEKWFRIIAQTPEKEYYMYSRSWRDDLTRQMIEAIAILPNASAWASADAETGNPADVTDLPIAYMSVRDDTPAYPVDLVFRTHRKTLARRVGNAPVCPHETGTSTAADVTCTRCGLCYGIGYQRVTRRRI